MGPGVGRTLALTAAMLALVAAGCEERRGVAVTGPTTSRGIVLESLTLEQLFFEDRCEVHGTIRNNSGDGQRVTLVFRAFDRRGFVIGTAVDTVDFVPAGARARYSALFSGFSDCDRVGRVELADVLFT